MGELSLRRYEIHRVLGRGGTGTVYEAYDTKNGTLVALKAVEASVAESLYRLKHEFRALSDVQHHNLVHFGELASEDGKWFFTMELVAGSSFIQYVRPQVLVSAAGTGPRHSADVGAGAEDADAGKLAAAAAEARGDADSDEKGDTVTKTVLRAWAAGTLGLSAVAGLSSPSGVVVVPRSGPSFDEARLRSSLRQLVEALTVIHDAGHVHRDVKPANVLIARDGRVVLLDFGLVTALAAAEHPAVDRSGTPAYMAPEQIEGVAVGPEADWYAVGTMLYLALTGTLPFSGPVSSVFDAKRTRDVPAPRQRVADVPADLDQLCVELLHRDPAQRPSVDSIRARLGLSPRAKVGPATGAVDVPFVGREAQQEVLRAALADVRRGGAQAVVVEGEAGVGKTALVQRFLAELVPSPVVLSGRCYEEEAVPFKGMDSIVDALAQHLMACSDVELKLLLAGGVRYLAAVFPVLNRVPAIRAATSAQRSVANEAGLREQAFDELARLMRALAARSMLVVFLDDLQWVDGDSLALLERAVLPGSGTRCLFLSTLRSDMALPPPVQALRAGAERLELGGLSTADACTLWDSLRALDDAGTAPANQRESRLRDTAVREAAGHPLFLSQLARFANAGYYDHKRGALLDVLWERVLGLSPLERRFLEASAVAGSPTPYEIIARAAQLDVGECLTHIGSLKSAQLLRVSLVDGERCVEPYHDRIRESIVGHLAGGAAEIARLHLQLGRALLAATPEEALRERVFTIVRHMNAASRLLDAGAERLRVAELDLLASNEARLATAYDRAREYARLGLELCGPGGWSTSYPLCRDLHMARMEAEHLAGDSKAARAVFDAARPHLATAEDTAALYSAWIILETGRGRFREGVLAGREALRALGSPIPDRVSMATVVRQYAANRLALRGRKVAELESLPELRDEKLRGALEILMAVATASYSIDTNLMIWCTLRIAGLSMRHGVCDVSAFGFGGYGMVLAGAFGKHEDAAGFGRLALSLNQRFASGRLAAKLHLLNGAFIAAWTRPFADAKALLRAAHELGMKHGDTAYEVYAATILSVVSFCESAELGAVQETGEWAREIATRRKDKDMAGVPDAHVRHAAALRGLTPGALDLSSPTSGDAAFRASLTDATTPITLFYYYFGNAELAYLSGDAPRAETLLAQAGKRIQGIFALPTTVELCFLGALVAARRHGDASRFEQARLRFRLQQAARKLDAWSRSCPVNFEAHALIVHAELARVRGKHVEAEDYFERAIAAARRHGSSKREALALELAAEHARARGKAAQAARWRGESASAYRRWGAIGKATAMARG